MPAAVTYDGVEGGEGGNIFDGIKFWVAQRVPMRTDLLHHIKSNAGTVVPLEKDATYMIADHVRKDAPTGSYSWKFITESVRNGILQLPDRYRIGWTPDIQRPAGSSRPTKRTRTDFTAEDDAALAAHVLSFAADRTGNKLYQEFEAMNDRHPWQSWRNRYMKTLMVLPPEALEALAAKASSNGAQEQQTSSQQAALQQVPASLEIPQRSALPPKTSHLKKASKELGTRRSLPKLPIPTTPALESHPSQSKDEAERKDSTERTEEEQEAIDRATFYRDLADYATACERQIAGHYKLCDHEFGLWDLAKAVAAQHVPAEEVDWMKVTEDLGFEWEIVEKASDALKLTYSNYLVDFLEMITSFQQSEIGEENHVDCAPPSSGATPSSPIAIPSSPPQPVLRAKRKTNPEKDSPVSKKRRRLGKNAEIPSTPQKEEHKPKRKRSRSRSHSRSRSRSHSRPHSSQAEDGELRFETQVALPVLPRMQTQETQVDVSPSQQLRSELLESSPPKQIKKGKKSTKGGKSKSPEKHLMAQTSRDESPLFVSTPAKKSATPVKAQKQKPTKSKSHQEQIAEWIHHYESLGYSHKHVLEGLQRTSMVPGIATVVMQNLKEGRGVPGNHEGIWTDRDDEGLRLMATVNMESEGDTSEECKAIRKAKRAAKRLEEKHGSDRIKLRRQFLAAQEK